MDDFNMTEEDFENLTKLASHANKNEPSGILAYATALDRFGFSEANRYFSMLIDSNSKDINVLGGYVKNAGILEDSKSYVFRMIPYRGGFVDCKLLIGKYLGCSISKINDNLLPGEFSGFFPANSKLLFSLFRRLYLLRDISHESIDSCVSDLRVFFDDSETVEIGTKFSFSKSNLVISHDLSDYTREEHFLKIPKFERFNDDFVALPLAKYQENSRLGSVVNVPWPDSDFFASLFGFGFKQAGAVFQYLSLPVNNIFLPNVNFLIDEFPCGNYKLSIGRISSFQFSLFATKEESFEDDFGSLEDDFESFD